MDILSEEQVQKLANLARVKLSSEESKLLAGEIPQILNYVSMIQAVDVSGVSIEDNLIVKNVLREDVAVPFEGNPSDLIAMSEDNENGFVKVKRIL